MLIQLESNSAKPRPRKLFYSYSHKDESLRDELDAHLALLKREGFIADWHDRKIRAGDDWERAISDNLNSADIILFLVVRIFLPRTTAATSRWRGPWSGTTRRKRRSSRLS